MTPAADPNPLNRPATWKWTICGLLLLASAINYMDRQTLANAAVRITREFHLSQAQYGNIEAERHQTALCKPLCSLHNLWETTFRSNVTHT